VTRRAAPLAVLAALALVPGVEAYLKFGARAGNRVVGLRWAPQALPIPYFITNRSASDVSAAELQQAVARAFATWAAVPTADLSAQFVSFTSTEPDNSDGVSVIGFQSRPDEENTLGSASFRIDDNTGALLAADIYFNAIFPWSVAPNGQPGRFDVESIAAHEIGHFLGLGHSLLGETELDGSGRRAVLGKRAVMFPIAYPRGNIEDRTLEPDDIAGITDVYATSAASRETGAVSGRVTLNGEGIFGAHVQAFNPTTGAVVGGFSLNDRGDFVIAGLVPGLYVVRVEPLDDADIDSFFDDDGSVNANFRATYYNRLVAVPAGGTSGNIEVKVQPK
jgi:hypothetical protein